MRLILPHPGHFSALKEIIASKESKGLKDVREVYMAGSPEVMGSGRATLYAPLIEDIKEQTAYAHQHNVKLNIAMNASCFGGYHLTFEGYKMFKWYFNELNKAGVDGVTVAEPYLVELLRDSPLETVISCVAHVDSPQRAEFFEDLGADAITVDTNINRNFEVLEAITKAVNCDIRVIVNEGCLYKCPFRHAHFNLFSHITASSLNARTQPLNTFGDYYFDKCISIRVRDPAGRANAVNWIINCMAAYSKGTFDGNLLELLDCPSELRYMFQIDNKLLDGSIKQWKNCKKICNECHYCDELTNKVLRVIEK
jgi:collagenase-like PrtC family protease